jgi:cytochrome b6-f complex iron-sulfur subunit
MKNTEKLNRVAFLKKMGLSSAAIFAAAYCSSSCTNETVAPNPNPNPTGALLTVDLGLSKYAKLTTKGNFIVENNIVLAHTSEGKYVAVPLTCSHEGEREVTYRNTEFYCTAHGARFDNSGVGLNTNGRKGLKLYMVKQTGNVLTIS